jgi:two-component system sensor histidine kinase KdpD
LRQQDISWTVEEQEALMATIEDGADRLDGLLTNLLDLSRLQSGAVRPRQDEVAVADVVSRALATVDEASVNIDIPDDLPGVIADAGLLERVLANILENAAHHTRRGQGLCGRLGSRSLRR